MSESTSAAKATVPYALQVADESYGWYFTAAKRARRRYRTSEVVQLLTSAAIPIAALVIEGNTLVPACLGAIVVITTGLSSIFHWHDNYLRFSQAREAVEAQRRRYRTQAPPYENPRTRDQVLTDSITAIERREMGSWLEIAGNRPEAIVPSQENPA
ncbi:DUF4231 domain-containing protein [Nocardia sp. NPDC049220]|uniref:DUF4231 domain-containing protein n=1 Tax=Nocardia sp. NPDC049220 TaxID=3155273 RepID=UPI003410D5A6